MQAIFSGFLTSAAISVVLFGIVAFFYMQGYPMGGWWRPFLATTAGVLLAIVLDRLTDYFTGTDGGPVQGDQGVRRRRPGYDHSGRPGRRL